MSFEEEMERKIKKAKAQGLDYEILDGRVFARRGGVRRDTGTHIVDHTVRPNLIKIPSDWEGQKAPTRPVRALTPTFLKDRDVVEPMRVKVPVTMMQPMRVKMQPMRVPVTMMRPREILTTMDKEGNLSMVRKGFFIAKDKKKKPRRLKP